MTIKFDQTKLRNICQSNDISYLGIFGSCAEGCQRKDSDVDLLVNFATTKSLLEKGKVISEMESLFSRDVDLVSANCVKPLLRSFISRQLIGIYGAYPN